MRSERGEKLLTAKVAKKNRKGRKEEPLRAQRRAKHNGIHDTKPGMDDSLELALASRVNPTQRHGGRPCRSGIARRGFRMFCHPRWWGAASLCSWSGPSSMRGCNSRV